MNTLAQMINDFNMHAELILTEDGKKVLSIYCASADTQLDYYLDGDNQLNKFASLQENSNETRHLENINTVIDLATESDIRELLAVPFAG